MTTRMSRHPLTVAAERDDTWYAFDAPYQRLQLFSSWSIFGFGLAMCVGLTLAYPYQSLEEKLAAESRQADRLTVEYLKVFLDAEPDAHGLRIRLVTQLIQLGAFAEARIALLPMTRSTDARLRYEAGWLELEMREQEAFALPDGTPRRNELLAQLAEQLGALVQQTPDSLRLLKLAHKALAIDRHEAASAALRRLANKADSLDAGSYDGAARAMLGLGDYRTSASLFFRAMQQAPSLEKRRDYFTEGLRTLQAGGHHDEAVAAADRHIGALVDDRDTLLFVIRLAQAANRLDVAQRYALRLLKLTLLRQLDRPHAMLASAFDIRSLHMTRLSASGVGHFVRTSSAQAGGPPGLPFDDEAYALGYNVFLANRNLPDARRVAESAVRQRPDSAIWRKRLAEVSEWSNLPQEALPQWLAYARMTDQDAAWDNVLRLSESLHDLDTMLIAVKRESERRPGDGALLDQLLSLYENAGEPGLGLELLRERLAGMGRAMSKDERRRELVLMAELSERMGQDQAALDTWKKLQAESGPSPAFALRIASLLERRGKPREAYAALEVALASAGAADDEFWRAFAELAGIMQDHDKAAAGYRRLLEADAQLETDLFNLASILEAKQPLAAARLAMYGFAKTRNLRFALLAVDGSLRAGDHAGALRFLQTISASDLDVLQKNPQFLAVRSALRQGTGDLAGAEHDLRAALAMRPGDSGYRSSMIWLLIARRDANALREVLAKWAGEAEDDAAMWGPFAAAHMALNRQREALHWFRKPGFLKDDYLWLMSYAEALDANSEPELAWRIRRHVWMDLRRPEILRQASAEDLVALRDRLVSLAPLFADGDRSAAILQALLQADVRTFVDMPPPATPRHGREMLDHLDRVMALVPENTGLTRRVDAPDDLLAGGSGVRPGDDVRMSATVRELALAYALNREAHDLARAWLATRFAQQLSRPLWGELSLVLALDDREQLGRLLDDVPDWLPMYDRIEAAQRAGRHGLAQSFAFEQMMILPHDEELHLRFTNMAAAKPPGFDTRLTDLQASPLQRRELRGRVHADLTPRLKLSFELGQASQSSNNATELAWVPGTDRMFEAGFIFQVPEGMLTATVHHRTAVHASTGMRLAYSLSAGNGIEVGAVIGVNQPTTETAVLRVGAMRSGVDAVATYSPSRTEYLRFGLGGWRYATQEGTHLGTRYSWTLEGGTHLRIEYPNLTLRLFVSGGQSAGSGRFDSQIARLLPTTVDLSAYRFLPQDDILAGISIGMGTTVDNRYTRAWRPYGEIGMTYSRDGGTGLNLSGGIAGSIFGRDTLQIRAMRSAGTPASPNGYREIGLDYKWLY